jgi:hypothetical protein
MKNKKNTTLSEQSQNIPHCQNSPKKYHTVRTVPKNTTLSEQSQKNTTLSNCRVTVRTVPKNTTLSEQSQKIPHRQNSPKKYHTVRTVLKSNTKTCRNRGKFNTTNTHIHDLLPSWLGTGTSFNKKWQG